MRRFASVASGLFACLAACGDDGGARHLQDAPPPPEDGPQPDGPNPVTRVNITAYARYFEGLTAMSPREGAVVLALDPSNAIIGTATTGADGKASVEMPNGGSVTISYPHTMRGANDYRSWITTYFGVKPGDSLTVGDSYSNGPLDNPVTGTMTVQFPTVAGAEGYYFYMPCARGQYYPQPGTGTTVLATVELNGGCSAATSPLAIVAYAAGNVIASVYLASTASTDGTALVLTAPQWIAQAGAPNYTATVTGLGTGADIYGLGAYGSYGTFSYDQFSSGATIDNGMATAMVSIPSTALRPLAWARVQYSGAGRQHFYKAVASPATLDSSTLPQLQVPAFDTKSRKVTWTQSAGTHDLSMLQFQTSYQDGADTHQVLWNVIVPPGTTELDGGAFLGQVEAQIPPVTQFQLLNVRAIDLANASSYDQARALPEWNLTYPQVGVGNGTITSAAIADGGEGYDFWQPYQPPM